MLKNTLTEKAANTIDTVIAARAKKAHLATKIVAKKATKKATTKKATSTTKAPKVSNKKVSAALQLKPANTAELVYMLCILLAFGQAKKSKAKGALIASASFAANTQLKLIGLVDTLYIYKSDLARFASAQKAAHLAATTLNVVLRNAADVSIDILGVTGGLADLLFVGNSLDNGLVKSNLVNRYAKHLVACGMHANGTSTAAGVSWPAKAPVWFNAHLAIDTSYSNIQGKGRSKIWQLIIKPVK